MEWHLVSIGPMILPHVEVDSVTPAEVDLEPLAVGLLDVELLEVDPHIINLGYDGQLFALNLDWDLVVIVVELKGRIGT